VAPFAATVAAVTLVATASTAAGAAPTAAGAAPTASTAAPTASSAAGAAPIPSLASARLQGSFELAGRVTVADNVRGEHAGDTVDRIWTFDSNCASGPCPEVGLVRQRARASDVLTLHLVAPGSYSGNGSFFAPLRCAGRVYPRGQKVPFTVTVTITSTAELGTAAIATRVNATYVNRRRINRTTCVAVLGHDSARYHGHVIAS
jgi:hypothetical protein